MNSFAIPSSKNESLVNFAGLRTCRDLDTGKSIHAVAALYGYETDLVFSNMLITMYGKCGSMANAHEVFQNLEHPDVTSWNALIFGYACNGQGEKALDVYFDMRVHSEDCVPDAHTFVAALKACACLAGKEDGNYVDGKLLKVKSLEKGLHVHDHVVRSAFRYSLRVAGTLVNMYAKCGALDEASRVFEGMKDRNVVSWTALVSGYVENREGKIALNLFARMEREGCTPDAQTYTVVLKACANVGALNLGKLIHAKVCLHGFHKDQVLLTALVDFYGKCGNMVDARCIFDILHTKDLVAWNALMAGYSSQGNGEGALKLFYEMENTGVNMNAITFLCLLTACCHAGLVEEGMEVLETMCSKYKVLPKIEHYTCLVDMLGRSNKLNDAIWLLRNMPVNANAVTWTIVLNACKRWKLMELGRLAFETLITFGDDQDAVAGAHVLMTNMYETRGTTQKVKIKTSQESCWVNQAGVICTFKVKNF